MEINKIADPRLMISTQLTKILMLYGRLHSDYNARYLPITVNSALVLINKMEYLEKTYYGFSEILLENIERREKYSNVFSIPVSLLMDPSTNGLRAAMYKLASPLIKEYCEEDKRFLDNLDPSVSPETRHMLFSRTNNNCEFLSVFCQPKDMILLTELKNWCENELGNTTCG